MGTLWNGWRACPSDEEALQLLLGSGTAAGVPVSGSGISTRAAAQPRRSSASRLIVDTRSARATVDAAEESIFVLAQQDAPSWRVFVDGVQSEKLLAGGIFRAVRIPRGGHEVEWRWVPTSFRAGATMTIITALSLHLIFFVKRFSRRKFSS
jgi:hypothetical protein